MCKQNTPTMMAAHQTERMVGRQDALGKIKQSIYASDNRMKIVLVRAQGGLGKTRLLEELLCRAGHPEWINYCVEPWTMSDDVVISDLVDVIDIRMHERNRFIKTVRDSLRHAIDVYFDDYDRLFDEFRRLKASGATFNKLHEAEKKATEAFITDLKRVTEEKRIVFVLDTVEQLRFVTSEWSLKKGLLTPADLAKRTYQWLYNLISRPDVNNITIILAGRGIEGKPFFTQIEGLDFAGDLIKVDLKPFGEEQTRAYFARLAKDWSHRADAARRKENGNMATNTKTENIPWEWIAKQFKSVADKEKDRYKVLWLYTGGVPVRLALYAQFIIEKRTLLPSLQWDFEKACTQAKTNTPEKSTPELMRIQWDIEDEFINLLFRETQTGTRVLQALVRSPRGLNAEQLHYVLDSGGESPEKWEEKPDFARLQELSQVLDEMLNFYLVKRRATWDEWISGLAEEGVKPFAERIGLQDEMYRIYAEHMAPHTEPVSDEIKEIWASLSLAEQKRYRLNKEDEKAERQEQYRKLEAWATYKYQQYLSKKRAYLEQDEKELGFRLNLDTPSTFRFPPLGTNSIEYRLAVQTAIDTFSVEKMVYALYIDPEKSFNNAYINLATATGKALEDDYDFWAQSEMWRIIYDEYSLKFANFHVQELPQRADESRLQVLRRAAEQEDVTRWIKRFVLRHEYKRGLEYAVNAEREIKQLATNNIRVWRSWNHTLIRVEREIWMSYAYIYQAEDVANTVSVLESNIDDLICLRTNSGEEVAVKREDGFEEYGFGNTVDQQPHPAYERLGNLISQAYNILGYGYMTLGRAQDAVNSYGHALYYVRNQEDVKAHQAVVLNNLSRALSSLGRQSIPMCRDGLELRRQLAQEVPLAYSYNTLALIYDERGRFEDAQDLVVKSIAYFRRASDERGTGLALLQLGETMRHLASLAQIGESVKTTPDQFYTVADNLLKEAYTIFKDSGEAMRLVQVMIELGSLNHNRLRYEAKGNASPRHWRKYRQSTESYLNRAVDVAKKHHMKQLSTRAQLNIARSRVYAANALDQDYRSALEAIDAVEAEISPQYFITPNSRPNPNDHSLTDVHWVLLLLGPLQTLRGRIALIEFSKRAASYKDKHPNNRERRIKLLHEDEEAQQFLAEAAKWYALALGYADLYEPGGRLYHRALAGLYDRLKGFNVQELDDFHDHALLVEKEYKTLRGAAVLGPFLHEFFGIPEDGHTHVRGSMHEVSNEAE